MRAADRTEYIVACIKQGGSMYPDDARQFLAQHDAHHRTEVLTEAKLETVAWLVKKAREQKTWDAGVLASKVDRGAVRAFIGTAHYRDAMDAHRAEVLAEVARLFDDRGRALLDGGIMTAADAAQLIREYAQHLGEGANGGTQPPAGEPTQPAPDRVQQSTAKLRALLTGGTPAPAGEWVSCTWRSCPNSERAAKATERGWTSGPMDAWLCAEHAPATDPAGYQGTRSEPGEVVGQ
jgi:hypothetical protein